MNGIDKYSNSRIWPGVVLLVFLFACRTPFNAKKDPFYESFFEKTSLIMTEEEIEIYLHLPDAESKREFIQDFWKLRDPDPSTEENENKFEFERRISFSDKWFDPSGGCRGWEVKRKSGDKPYGWNTDRGRLYIVMGPPDQISLKSTMGMWEQADPLNGTLLCRAGGWRYLRYNRYFYFGGTPGAVTTEGETEDEIERRASSTVSTNTDVMERAKLDMISPEYKGLTERPFRFTAEYEGESLKIRISSRSVSFLSAAGRLTAQFDCIVNVYANNRKVETLREEKTFECSEEEALRLKNIELVIPCRPKARGRILFDIVIGHKVSMATLRYRDYVVKNFK